MKSILSLVIMAITLVFASCSSSKITRSWKSEKVQANSHQKILVVALVREDEPNLRQKMEDHFIGDLASHGYTAISSAKEFGFKSMEQILKEQGIESLLRNGIDAVITIVLLDKARDRVYTEASVYDSPNAIYLDHFRMYGNNFLVHDHTITSAGNIHGYYQEDTRYFWESNFYDLASEALVYSVQTESLDPSSTESLAHEYGKLIVKDMATSGIIK